MAKKDVRSFGFRKDYAKKAWLDAQELRPGQRVVIPCTGRSEVEATRRALWSIVEDWFARRPNQVNDFMVKSSGMFVKIHRLHNLDTAKMHYIEEDTDDGSIEISAPKSFVEKRARMKDSEKEDLIAIELKTRVQFYSQLKGDGELEDEELLAWAEERIEKEMGYRRGFWEKGTLETVDDPRDVYGILKDIQISIDANDWTGAALAKAKEVMGDRLKPYLEEMDRKYGGEGSSLPVDARL